MASIKEDTNSLHSAESREMDRERERDREREHENELLQSPSKFQAQTKTQTPETGSSVGSEKYVRVRDMINLYNFAMQKNQELEQAKSILFGMNQETESDMPGDMPVDMTSSEMDKEGGIEGGQATMSQLDENLSVAKSYQSKTTLRRTEKGVRITIEIFMDKNDSEIDLVGSRVETDIPESRVLTEFQQEALELEKLKLKLKQTQASKIEAQDQEKRT